MKFYKLAIGSPVYQEVYNYSSKKMKKIIKDECRKHLILRFSARYTTLEDAHETLEDLIAHFTALTGSTEVNDLAKISWGEPSTYDEKRRIFQGAICIPKDFDGLIEQKEFLALACKEKEDELNEFPMFIDRRLLELEKQRKDEYFEMYGLPGPC